MNEQMLIVGSVLAAAVLAGGLVGRSIARRLGREVVRLSGELSRAEAQVRDQSRASSRLRSEQRSYSNLARSLPNVVRELNSSDLDPRKIPRLLIDLTESVFEPEQALLYLVRSPGEEDDSPKEIYLRSHRGLRPVPGSVERIRIGEGKIGWVATHRVEMLAEDWLNMSRTEGRNLEDNHPLLRLDMIAPLVQHVGMKQHLLGVLCVGRPTERPRDEKLMIQLIANLGALALMNTRNVSKIRKQANHDGLTGLLNKRHFMQELGHLIHRAEQSAQPLGIFIFDIDHFKNFNDSNGHVAGDELLKSMARLLRDGLRPDDLACRYGGEEFIVAMSETDVDSAFQIAERLRQAIASHPFPHGETQPSGKLTISGGVAAFPVNGTEGTELIRNADQALYQAKASGRNKVLLYRGVEIGDAGWQDGEGFQVYDEPPGVEPSTPNS